MTWKVLAQMVESTWLCWEDLDSSHMYANCVLFNCYYFKYMLIMWWDNIII